MNFFLQTKKNKRYSYFSLFSPTILQIPSLWILLFFLLPLFQINAQSGSLAIDTEDPDSLLVSVIKVYNETTCPMTLYCYKINDIGELLNIGVLLAGYSTTIRPEAELGRIYAKNPLTDEETASIYFYGGEYDLIVSSGCIATDTSSNIEAIDTSSNIEVIDTNITAIDTSSNIEVIDTNITAIDTSGNIEAIDTNITAIDTSSNIEVIDTNITAIDTNSVDTISYDCPYLSANIGDSCDDGLKHTKNDKITAKCTCKGLSDCDAVKITSSDGYIAVGGLNTSAVNSVQVFTMDWKPIFTCAGNCRGLEYIWATDDKYRVKVTYYTKAWAQVCSVSETILIKRNVATNNTAMSRKGIMPSKATIASNEPILSVYPNPASSELVVELGDCSILKGHIRLVNLSGQIIREIHKEALEGTNYIDVSEVNRGLYLLQVQLEDGFFRVEKILIK